MVVVRVRGLDACERRGYSGLVPIKMKAPRPTPSTANVFFDTRPPRSIGVPSAKRISKIFEPRTLPT